LFSPTGFDELVSGRRRGMGAAALRFGLRLAEIPYTAAVRWRNRRYDRGWAAVHRVPVPVISVGNLTLGGTGKTPMVEWLAGWLAASGLRVTLISRGYGARSGSASDEALELQQKLPGVAHLQDPDRVAAATKAVARDGAQVLVLDDAFQHRRLGRDLDIVLLDAFEPFGHGHVFPRGTLREPIQGLGRADVVALSRADLFEQPQRAELRRRVEAYAPRALWLEVFHAPRGLVAASGREAPLETLRDNGVAAFCGIGNPAGFRHTLVRCGMRVLGFREFPDHHAYGPDDLAAVAAWADDLGAQAVVCTEKDLVKVCRDQLGRRPLWALRIGQEFLHGREALEARLNDLLSRRPPGVSTG